MILLAENNIDPNFAWQLMLCLAGAAHFCVKVLEGIAHAKTIKAAGKPMDIKQPFEVAERTQFAEKRSTDAKLHEMKQAIEGLRRDINDMDRRAIEAAHTRLATLKDELHKQHDELSQRFMDKLNSEADGIYKRVNEQLDRISRLEGKLEAKSKS